MADMDNFIERLSISECLGSIKVDVKRIKNQGVVPSDVTVSEYLFDVKTGKLTEVI